MNINQLNLTGVRNMGDIFIEWEGNNVLSLIRNQNKTTFYEKAEQFRVAHSFIPDLLSWYFQTGVTAIRRTG